MKNKGFTLIELLAVLTILAIVALVTVPAITNSLKSYKQKLYQNQIDNIESAARVWGADHIFILPNDTNSTKTEVYSKDAVYAANYKKLTITLKDLKDEGYIDSDIKNTNTQKPFDDSMKIIISKNGKKIVYNVIDQSYNPFEVGDKISVNVGSATFNFYVIEDSGEDEENLKLLLENSLSSAGQVTWDNIPEKLDELKDSWKNAQIIRTISKEEYQNVKTIIANDTDNTWIYSMNYWTNTEDGANAYMVSTTGAVSSMPQTNSYYIRPVIEISKDYIKTDVSN